MLKRTIAGLTQDQPVRKHMDPEGAAQIDNYVAKIEDLLGLKEPFHVVRNLAICIRKFDGCSILQSLTYRPMKNFQHPLYNHHSSVKACDIK